MPAIARRAARAGPASMYQLHQPDDQHGGGTEEVEDTVGDRPGRLAAPVVERVQRTS
jgi:hypothetical protein